MLVDAEVDGAPKKLALHADRNGFAYAIDRTSGEFVWGTQFVKELTWTRGLDKATGLPLDYDPNKRGPALSRRHRAVALQPGRHRLPGQHGRQELAADRVPSRAADLVHPGDRELQRDDQRRR